MKIGIMQGRLLPRYRNRYQSHPLNYWQAEFFIARDLGFDQIELILDYNDCELNPLLSKDGIKEIKSIIKETKVTVKSVCADYFMEAPFHSKEKKNSEKILNRLLDNCKDLNIKDIVIPCVDHASLKNKADLNSFVQSIQKCLGKAEDFKINLNFETDLNPKRFKKLLKCFNNSDYIKVNYDIGNSAALGYDPKKEFKAYGNKISDLHIKDRLSGSSSVELGKGNADLNLVFKLLKETGFSGNIIMQAARDEFYIDDLILIKKQKKMVKKLINKYLI